MTEGSVRTPDEVRRRKLLQLHQHQFLENEQQGPLTKLKGGGKGFLEFAEEEEGHSALNCQDVQTQLLFSTTPVSPIRGITINDLGQHRSRSKGSTLFTPGSIPKTVSSKGSASLLSPRNSNRITPSSSSPSQKQRASPKTLSSAFRKSPQFKLLSSPKTNAFRNDPPPSSSSSSSQTQEKPFANNEDATPFVETTKSVSASGIVTARKLFGDSSPLSSTLSKKRDRHDEKRGSLFGTTRAPLSPSSLFLPSSPSTISEEETDLSTAAPHLSSKGEGKTLVKKTKMIVGGRGGSRDRIGRGERRERRRHFGEKEKEGSLPQSRSYGHNFVKDLKSRKKEKKDEGFLFLMKKREFETQIREICPNTLSSIQVIIFFFHLY